MYCCIRCFAYNMYNSCCIRCFAYNMNYTCVALLPYAYLPKRRVRFSNNLSIYSTYQNKMIR